MFYNPHKQSSLKFSETCKRIKVSWNQNVWNCYSGHYMKPFICIILLNFHSHSLHIYILLLFPFLHLIKMSLKSLTCSRSNMIKRSIDSREVSAINKFVLNGSRAGEIFTERANLSWGDDSIVKKGRRLPWWSSG